MTIKNTEPSQVDSGSPQAPPPPSPASAPGPPQPLEHLNSRGGNKVIKSGPLFISSKGIGWTSWKKRWFILTRTSLVFFRSDPNAVAQKGSEVNLTLGGIDLNNSGSVVVKADKKLLTVLFPDGRAFTLKAETSEDLLEWKTALEEALAQAPNAALVMGQNGIFRNEQADAADEQTKDRQPVKSLVIGRPILLALEDIDGTPSFLEKALRFIEGPGVKVEGILRQAADVDDVERRIQEYEQGKVEFTSEDDPHVVGDCIKYILRELPSSPVPASCCTALLDAWRTDRGMRLNAIRSAICETFPEPNRRLLQRILMMMQTVASHKAENRMSSSAVAACMAPLLLRPLLAGDCELEHDFDVGGDGSVQLLQAAAAANHAQAIVITLLEEYDTIFGEGSLSAELYSDSEESGSESEELSDDDEYYEDDEDEDEDEDEEDDEYDEDDDATEGSDADVDEDYEHASSESSSEAGDTRDSDLCNDEGSESPRKAEVHDDLEVNQLSASSLQTSLLQDDNVQRSESFQNQRNDTLNVQPDVSSGLVDDPAETSFGQKVSEKSPSITKSISISNEPTKHVRRPAVWGRTPARKNLSMESINLSSDDEAEVKRLEITKTDLQNRLAMEVKGNEKLQESLERRKKALYERRLALEQDVARLLDQLQKEKALRTALEFGLKMSRGILAVSSPIGEKMKAELVDIAQAEEDILNLEQKADNLGQQLNQQRKENDGLVKDMREQPQQAVIHKANQMTKKKHGGANSSHISTRSKDDSSDESDSDKEMKQENRSSSNIPSPQNQQSDTIRTFGSAWALVSDVEPSIGRPPLTNSKKYGSRGEGSTSTSPALSKLTNRLNFLKERRSQVANELQILDISRSAAQPVQNSERDRVSESQQSQQNLDKHPEPEGQPSNKGRASDNRQSVCNPEKGIATEEKMVRDKEQPKKSDGQLHQKMDTGNMDGHPVPNLERGKSESFPTVGKGRGSGGKSLMPPRTYSR